MLSMQGRVLAQEVLKPKVGWRDDARGPDKSRRDICQLKLPLGHFVHAGDHRDDRANGAKKMTEEDAERAPSIEKRLPFFEQSRIAVERPNGAHVIFVVEADPIRHRVAERAAKTGRENRRPQHINLDAAFCEQCRNADKYGRARPDDRKETKTFEKGDDESHGRRPCLMSAHECHDYFDEIVDRHLGELPLRRHTGGWLKNEAVNCPLSSDKAVWSAIKSFCSACQSRAIILC